MSSHAPRAWWILAAPLVFLILWSAGFSVAKIALAQAQPLTVLALRYGVTTAILLPVALILRPAFPRGRASWNVVVVGVLIQVAYFGFCYVAFKMGTSAGAVAVVVCLQPILTALAAPHLTGETIGRRGWIGLALGLTGALLAILGRSTVAAESGLGLLACVVALFGITGGTLYEKRFGAGHHPVAANLIQYAAALALCLPAAWLTEDMGIHWTPDFLAAMAYLVLGNSLLAMTLLLAMIRAGEVARVSSLFYLVPPLSALFAWPLLGETMPPLAWAGMGLAAAGVAMVTRRRKAPVPR
ncbi:DMT family transporter [Neotabrizicola sp. sgz301269]|uniref:DMT family transporter n=1 Tax=Neotabrizicola sp. sgz301269 TaxID=3276282 RepID=UPI00376F6E6C